MLCLELSSTVAATGAVPCLCTELLTWLQAVDELFSVRCGESFDLAPFQSTFLF